MSQMSAAAGAQQGGGGGGTRRGAVSKAVVFVDLQGSTALWGSSPQRVSRLARECEGELVKLLGDAAMLAFDDLAWAVRFAVLFQSATTGAAFRVGVAHGPVRVRAWPVQRCRQGLLPGADGQPGRAARGAREQRGARAAARARGAARARPRPGVRGRLRRGPASAAAGGGGSAAAAALPAGARWGMQPPVECLVVAVLPPRPPRARK